jgi:serine/threonine-protein kinase
MLAGARMPAPELVDPLAHTALSESVDPRAETLPSDTDPRAPHHLGARRTAAMIGHVLGHFRVDALLGEGGMGAVYRAWDTSLLRPVALKVVLTDSPAARARFLREARAQAQLRHPHVVPIHYVGEAAGVVFLVMDLVEGESLADLLRREPKIDAHRALGIADEVASALEAGAAAGLIHRDVKPSNILLEKSGRALLADFGLAKEIASRDLIDPSAPEPEGPVNAALTREGAIVGTPAYLAPEQASGAQVDHRAVVALPSS